MSDRSSIEWTDASWNPIQGAGPNRWMCAHQSPGCDHCYAETMNVRWGGGRYQPVGGTPEVQFSERVLEQPLHWKQPRLVFVCSMTDLFGEWVPHEWMRRMFEVMRQCPQHQFQVLTKRPTVMHDFVISYLGTDAPFANVWLGVSIELDQYHWRANVLRNTPAAVRFVSAEPLLGPLPHLDLTAIDWLIAGGESGNQHRPCEAAWVRDLRDRAQQSETAFFFKQWGGRTHSAGGRDLDGRTWDEYPSRAVVIA
jgi:protein gp37